MLQVVCERRDKVLVPVAELRLCGLPAQPRGQLPVHLIICIDAVRGVLLEPHPHCTQNGALKLRASEPVSGASAVVE